MVVCSGTFCLPAEGKFRFLGTLVDLSQGVTANSDEHYAFFSGSSPRYPLKMRKMVLNGEFFSSQV